MPDSIELSLQVPSVPEGFCNNLGEDWVQSLLNLFGQSVAILNTGSGAGTILLNQESLPSPEQRNFLWRRPSRGSLIFSWDSGGGAWTAPNPIPANGIERRLMVGTPAEIWAYDGGDGSDPSTTPPAANVGAMWEIDPDFAGRVAIGVGAIPGTNPAKSIALEENYGAGSITLAQTNLPAISLTLPAYVGDASGGGTYPTVPHDTSTSSKNFPVNPTPLGDATPFSVVMPGRGAYYCRRTARTNFVAS